jgi:hypothetical protein
MAFVRHVIKALIQVDRRAAKKVVKQAYVDAQCSITDAASSIGCGRRTFLLWARELGLEDWLRSTGQIAKRDGWHHEKVGGGGCHKARRESNT